MFIVVKLGQLSQSCWLD